MLRRVARVLRVGLLVMGAIAAVLITASLWLECGIEVGAETTTTVKGGAVRIQRLSVEPDFPRDDPYALRLIANPVERHWRTWDTLRWQVLPHYHQMVRGDDLAVITFSALSVPLWPLMLLCLAWPVTSFIVARRRRKGRGFEVETKTPSEAPKVRAEREPGASPQGDGRHSNLKP